MKAFQRDFSWTYAEEFRNRYVLKAAASRGI